MVLSDVSRAGLLGMVITFGAGRASAAQTGGPAKWRTICTLTGDDLDFAGGQIESGGAPREVDHAHADHATVAIEVDGTHARVRAHATAPFDFVLTTTNFGWASLSLRGGAKVGVVTAEKDGVVRIERVSGDGRAMAIEAGNVTVGGLPLRCGDLVAGPVSRYWMLGGMSHDARGLRRLFVAPGVGRGFPVDAVEPLPVQAGDTAPGDWRAITHFGYASGEAGFSVSGWARGVRVSEGGTTGGGGMHEPGLRSCAPHTPARVGFVTLPAGSALFDGSSGGKEWARLTAPLRVLVALYPRERAAVAGLPGWSWPLNRCETAWVDAEGLVLETTLAPQAPAPPAE